jgi:hypothetical protein
VLATALLLGGGHEGEQPVVDLADELLGPLVSKFLARVEHDVQAATTSCFFDHVDRFIRAAVAASSSPWRR